jgi:hypothetical protein
MRVVIWRHLVEQIGPGLYTDGQKFLPADDPFRLGVSCSQVEQQILKQMVVTDSNAYPAA